MPTKKSIAFLCHPYHRGGVTRWMADAAIDYTNNGYEVYFATLLPTVTFFSGQVQETMVQLLSKSKNNIHIGTLPVGREFEFGSPEYVIYQYKQVLAATVPSGTPVIISDDPSVWAAATSLHNTYPVVGVLHADESAYYNLTEKYHHLTDVLVSVSARVTRTVLSRFPAVSTAKIFTIPCGINLPPVNNSPENNTTVLQLIYVGRVNDTQKRSGDLLKIATALRKQHIPFQLNIIGDGGAYKEDLEKNFIQAGFSDAVFFKGWLSQAEVAQYLQTSAVMILPSDFEGMPIAMMEALASGCGFVGTRVSGIEDYEFHALAPQCFGVYEVGDIADAVRKIQHVAAIPVATRRQAARQLAESQFSMAICFNNYNAAIATIPAKSYTPASISISPITILKSRIIAIARNLKMSLKK